jgi:hypothetical protein
MFVAVKLWFYPNTKQEIYLIFIRLGGSTYPIRSIKVEEIAWQSTSFPDVIWDGSKAVNSCLGKKIDSYGTDSYFIEIGFSKRDFWFANTYANGLSDTLLCN